MIGSIFYFTTGLHGFHVLFGSFGFFLTLWLILFVIHGILSSINASIYYSGCIDLISLFGLLFGLPMAIDFLCSLFLSSLFFLDHEPLLTLSIQTETSELLEQAFSYLFLYSFLYLSFFIDSTIGFSYKHFRIRIKHNHFLFDHFLSSSSYYFELGSTLWNWIAVLGTYSIFAFSFSFSSSLYSWQSCCYVPFYLFDINRFLIIPLWTSFKIIVFCFDVISSFGLYCFGIKIDAIPGRINLASTLRSLFKGEHRGFCFELCGQGHSSMLIVGLILTFTLPGVLIVGFPFPNFIFLLLIVHQIIELVFLLEVLISISIQAL